MYWIKSVSTAITILPIAPNLYPASAITKNTGENFIRLPIRNVSRYEQITESEVNIANKIIVCVEFIIADLTFVFGIKQKTSYSRYTK